ncbi:hypothetical protein Q7P35_003063 [Cladosporium inversicolor]
MSSHQPSASDRKQSKASDTSSILSTSTTSSMSALLKSKLTPKSKSKAVKPEKEELSPGEKQAIRRQDRMSYQTLATIASMKQKAAKLFEDEPERAVDAYQARKATQFLRAGSL